MAANRRGQTRAKFKLQAVASATKGAGWRWQCVSGQGEVVACGCWCPTARAAFNDLKRCRGLLTGAEMPLPPEES